MEKHFGHTDVEFEEKFRNCTLHPSEFSHEAHLRLAWIHVNKYGISQAEENIQTQLQDFIASAGEQQKYNTTLTLASIKIVYHFMLRSKAQNFKTFITEFPKLKHNFKALIDCHYGFDIFNAEKAKTHFLPPDLLAFD